MVVKIEPATEHCETCFRYNQNKVEAGHAMVLYMANIDDPNDPLATLERYERASRRCQKPSFHMSINPSDTDGMSDEQITEFVKELMAGMGYGDQPVILYKHLDIDRIHYHVVSVRVDKEGKKIKDSNEQRRCQALLKKLAAKYGFTIGNGQKKKEEPDDKAFTSKAAPHFLDPEGFHKWLQDNPPPDTFPEDAVFVEKVTVKKFSPKKGDYSHQIEQLVEQALKYNFTSINQYKALMKSFRVHVDFKRKGLDVHVTYAGINPKTGKRCMEPIKDKKLNIPNLEDINLHMEQSSEKHDPEAKRRIVNALNIAMNHCTSEAEVRKMLAKLNISMTLTKNKQGQISSVTYVDHQTKHVYADGQVKGFGAAEWEKARLERWGEAAPKDERKASPMAEAFEILMEAAEQQKDLSWMDDVYFKERRRGPRRY